MSGFGTMLAIQCRTQWRALAVSVIALTGSMVATAAAVAGLYDTPAKIHTYAQAVGAGNALAAINGRVEGIDSLGGVIQDEFGFLAAFVLPLLGISLVTRTTRREEEAGRLETLLGGRIARHAPTTAALVWASAAIAVTTAGFAAGLVSQGVPVSGSILYAGSLGALAFTFAGLAGLLAQVTLHARSVYAAGLITLALAYVLRGAGDVSRGWVTWLSPLGWAEKAAPFGAQRWWTLAIPAVVGTALAGSSVWLASRRDLGSALLKGHRGPARASSWLRSPLGMAARLQRPALLGWITGSVLLAGMLGSLSRQLLDAMQGNPSLAQAIGVSGGRPTDGFVAMAQLYLTVIATGYTLQTVGLLRDEEASGRLEPRLTGTLTRSAWLAAHGLVIGAGLIAIDVAGSGVLAMTTTWSLGDTTDIAGVLRAGTAYFPAELTLAALALALFGLRPRAYPAAWAAYAVTTFIALLGPGLQLPRWILDLAPTTRIGNPPVGSLQWPAITLLVLTTATLVILAFTAFRHRGIPQR